MLVAERRRVSTSRSARSSHRRPRRARRSRPRPRPCPPRATRGRACDPKATRCPAPSDFAPDPTVARIQPARQARRRRRRGHEQLGLPRPEDGEIEGLDVDLLTEDRRTRSSATPSPPQHLKFTTLTTAERIDAVADGKVDMVASLLTATCERWQKVDFSTEYFEAHQGVLVPVDSDIHSVADLAGKTVCATRGSTSIDPDPRAGPDGGPVPGGRARPTAWSRCRRVRSTRSPATTPSSPASSPRRRCRDTSACSTRSSRTSTTRSRSQQGHAGPRAVRELGAAGDARRRSARAALPGPAGQEPTNTASEHCTRPEIPIVTTLLADLDARIDRYRNAADTISANLLELDHDPNRQLLDQAPLRGATATAWADARGAITTTWEWYAAFGAFLDRVTDLRVSPRTRLAPGRERDLAELPRRRIDRAARRRRTARGSRAARSARRRRGGARATSCSG